VTFAVGAISITSAVTVTAPSAGATGVLTHTAAQIHNPYGYLDRVTISNHTVTVVGWTFDPDAPTHPIQVAVNVDHRRQLLATTTHNRPSVSRHFHRAITTPGYLQSFNVSYGRHLVCTFGMNVGPGTWTGIACQRIVVPYPNAVKAQNIAAMAKSFVGHVPYTTAGTNPRTGFDCSGLTMYVYGRQGISLVHSADAQYHHFRGISQSAARPGDLVFFLSGSYAYHVAVYEGGNMIVAAATYGEGVKYQQIWSSDVRFGTLLH
jgi:cell wall-associated NlpC family hydrolase